VRQRIRSAAARLLSENGVKKPPVPVEDLAPALGAEIRYSPFEGDVSGMLFRHDGQAIIGVNSLHHPNRQRFTIAHEIAHLVLHKGMEVHVDRTYRINLRDDISSQAVDREEIDANSFAAELLMPEPWLIEDLKGQDIDCEGEDDDDLRGLARKYGVSLKALTLRLTNLGLIAPE
jgi:Zn-dependent peptidase ImmA (M78 family)